VVKRILILVCLLAAAMPLLRAQEMPTQERAGELQIGIGYSKAKPDYTDYTFTGESLYADYDFRDHWGIEGDFHYVKEPSNQAGGMYEKTYEIGPRYLWHISRFDPYVKLLFGRGVFNYPNNSANLAYNMYSFGGGCDIRVKPYLNVRLIDVELQKWGSFPPNGLSPIVYTFGVAYRFH
jgi:hypothetical protein